MLSHKYPAALFIGRFQPFHNGHLYSLQKSFEVGESVIIGIGSSTEEGTEKNPYDYAFRKKMVLDVLGDEGLRVSAIEQIPDFPSDEEWATYVENIVRSRGYENKDAVIVGNNEWTNDVLEKAGFNVYESGLYNRDELEGVKIRELMKKGDRSWKQRVPEAVWEMLKNN